MADFLQQVVSGLASGAIFASLALALVLIYRATDVVNFAQGEMATFSTYIAWSLMDHGMSYWPAFVLTLVARLAYRSSPPRKRAWKLIKKAPSGYTPQMALRAATRPPRRRAA